jgi:hypothetical protein
MEFAPTSIFVGANSMFALSKRGWFQPNFQNKLEIFDLP